MRTVPITLRAANAFVAAHHRHHQPARGCLFVTAVEHEGKVVGVAVVGRPVSRLLDDGQSAELTRLCTDGTKNAASFLLGVVRRVAMSLGYRRVTTYTLPEEGGASLRAAGWSCMGEAGGGTWDRPNRKRTDKAPTGIKLRWEA